jgi:hypothetical protein
MTAKAMIGAAMARARDGVDYSPKDGAVCPMCGKRCPVVSSPKWSGDIKIRYHRCRNKACVMATARVLVKSVQDCG